MAFLREGLGCFELASSGWSGVLGIDAVGGPPHCDFANKGGARVTSRWCPDWLGVTLAGVAQHLPQGRCQGDRHLNFHESRDKSIALTRKAPAYGVGQGFQRTGPARSGGSSTGPVHETKTGSASAMVGDGRVGDCCVVYRWS